MSEVRLVLRDRERDLSGTIHGSMADRAIAALSAEPETIGELEVAMQRFHVPYERGFFASFRQGVNDEPYDAGLVVIDLAARLIVCDSTYSSPSHSGSVNYHDGRTTTFHLRYHLPEDWKFSREAVDWDAYADTLRQTRLARPLLEARAILFGKPALEFMIRECFAAFRDRPAEPPPTEKFYGDESMPEDATEADYTAVREIHARWLTSPRDDLGGQAPRDVLLAQKEHINWDLQDRSEQWAKMQQCPRPLAKDSWAYRYAGFGTHQIVVYYYLVRHLLWSCYRSLLAIEKTDRAMMQVGDFLTAEMPRLSEVRETYLDTPEPEYSGRTPRHVMERERMRLPEGVSGHEAMIDCNCPLCQMQAELPGPAFWHLDGCNMDDEFAFSDHRTREEWDQEQREREEWNRRWEAKQKESERLGVRYPGAGYADPNYVWERSFVAESKETSPMMRLFAIGSLLCELTCDLKETTENQPLIEGLSRDWGNLREVVGATDAGAQPALIEAVLDRFCQSLSEVAESRPDLEPKCSDLATRLRRFTEPPSEKEENEEDYGYLDGGEMPF